MRRNWSFSSLMNFEKCPHSVTFPYKERNSEAALRGIDMHTSIEDYLLGRTNECPFPDLPFHRLMEGCEHLHVEEKWGFDQDWNVCDYRAAWLKVKCDTVVATPDLITVIDYKSGKSSGNEIKHTQQTQLYMAAAAKKYPDAPLFTSELWYVDESKVRVSRVYEASALEPIRERWSKRGKIMTAATQFPPKPSKSNCKFCDFKTECEYAYEE